MTEQIEIWWSPYQQYSVEQLAEHDLVPTSEIEEFDYVSPYPADGPVPCNECRGQGAIVDKRYEGDKGYRIFECVTCSGTTELQFLCSSCGTTSLVTNARQTKDLPDSIVRHHQWCPECELCMSLISSGEKTCCRPIVARFDLYAKGQMWGFCGVHSRGKQEEEERNARWALDRLERDWRNDEVDKKEATVEDRIAAAKKKLGIPEDHHLEHRMTYDGTITVNVPLEMLEAYVGIDGPDQTNDIGSLIGFEAGEGPEPF